MVEEEAQILILVDLEAGEAVLVVSIRFESRSSLGLNFGFCLMLGLKLNSALGFV